MNDFETEPNLKKIDNEGLNGLTRDDARPDIRACGGWRQGQDDFFDIRLPVSAILIKKEKERKRAYNCIIMNVEHGNFTPMDFSLTGGEGPETSMFHRRITQKKANKTEGKYEQVQILIRYKLSNFEVSFVVYQRKSFRKKKLGCLG